MFSKVIFLTLLGLIAINYCRSQRPTQLSAACMRLIELNTKANRSTVCHYPLVYESSQFIYMQSLEPKENYKIIAWYYEPTIRSCRPLYGYLRHNTCPCNEDITKEKQTCEEVCGHPCEVRGDEPDQILPGVCMDPKFCAMPESDIIDPKVCSQYGGAKCCRRDLEYVYPGYTSDGSPPKENNDY